TTVTPAVTCSAQATFLTGAMPSAHGIVANGWYYRDTAEVALWRQSAALVGGEKIWDAARERDPSFTCAQLFWWFNMYASVELAEKAGAKVVALSEYGITKVSSAVHVNRALREAGLLAVRREAAGEQLDAGASAAFAVADHQVAHVYVKRPEQVPEVKALLEK